jgi:hypothetical protein
MLTARSHQDGGYGDVSRPLALVNWFTARERQEIACSRRSLPCKGISRRAEVARLV